MPLLHAWRLSPGKSHSNACACYLLAHLARPATAGRRLRALGALTDMQALTPRGLARRAGVLYFTRGGALAACTAASAGTGLSRKGGIIKCWGGENIYTPLINKHFMAASVPAHCACMYKCKQNRQRTTAATNNATSNKRTTRRRESWRTNALRAPRNARNRAADAIWRGGSWATPYNNVLVLQQQRNIWSKAGGAAWQNQRGISKTQQHIANIARRISRVAACLARGACRDMLTLEVL